VGSAGRVGGVSGLREGLVQGRMNWFSDHVTELRVDELVFQFTA
jgi:hypothetical protein